MIFQGLPLQVRVLPSLSQSRRPVGSQGGELQSFLPWPVGHEQFPPALSARRRSRRQGKAMVSLSRTPKRDFVYETLPFPVNPERIERRDRPQMGCNEKLQAGL